MHDRIVRVNASCGHAVVLGFDDHRHASRLKHALDGLGDFFGHAFLNLETSRKGVNDAPSFQAASPYFELPPLWKLCNGNER